MSSADWEFAGGAIARDTVWVGGFFRRRNAPAALEAGEAGRSRPATPNNAGPPIDAPVPEARTWLKGVRLAQAGIARARQIAEADPGNHAWWRTLARRYRMAGLPSQAVETFKRAQLLDPTNPDNDAFRAEMLRAAGKNEAAFDAISRALQRDPKNGDMNLLAGLLLLEMRRPAEARPHLLAAVQKLPTRMESHYLTGRMYADLRLWSEAEPYFLEALRLNPSHDEVRRYAMESFVQQGKFDRAEELLQETIRHSPRGSLGYLLLGDFYSLRGQTEKATNTWRTGLEATGGDSTIAARLKFTRPPATQAKSGH
jgi:tetratricopeptide (TPR) repeat protein